MRGVCVFECASVRCVCVCVCMCVCVIKLVVKEQGLP